MSLNLQDLDRLKKNPETKSAIIEYEALALGITQEYSDFVSRITHEIDLIIIRLESSRDLYKDQEEDLITDVICMQLQARSIDATHGTHSSGSTDLLVKHGQCLWIAEAKWWDKTEDALEGMRQLSTRYASGGDRATSGGVLLYNRTGNLANKIKGLKSTYIENRVGEFRDISVSSCNDSSFAFKTKHKSPASGLEYEVRHRALNFYYSPQDKSGKATRARRESKRKKRG